MTIDDFFATDGMEPAQWFARQQRHAPTGAEMLLLSILDSARADLVRYRNVATVNGRRLYQDARFWVEGAPVTDGFTFVDVCEHLQLDAGRLRRGLLTMADASTFRPFRVRAMPVVRPTRLTRRAGAV